MADIIFNKMFSKIGKSYVLLGFFFVVLSQYSFAQYKFENAMSQYFHNRSLLNPAFSGMDGNKFQLIQNRSWIGFDGAPVLTVFTGEFNFGLNSSGGAHVFSDKSGIVYRTTGLLNYAYRIKLNQKSTLKLGISFSVSSERLDNQMLDAGAVVDPLVAANINGLPTYDGNFGVLYIADKLTIGTSFFRIGENLSKSTLGKADLLWMKGGIYYHFNKDLPERVQFRPLLMLSLYQNLPAVFDGGAQVIFNKYLNAMIVYQSTSNLKSGAGIMIPEINMEANFFYNTNLNKAGVSAQQFELGIKYNFSKKN